MQLKGGGPIMNSIELCSNHISSVTLVSNYFIDTYMPAANGSYVKIYLYLLRCLSNVDCNMTISSIADRLEDSEKDILRALAYWEKVNVLSLKKDSEGNITQISLNELMNKEISVISQIHKSNTEVSITKEPISHKDKPTYTAAQIEELSKCEDVKWLLKIIEIYLERFLKPADIQLILYLYESVGFSVELIMYLYEYCISKNKKNPAYIEAVALSWAEEGINTVEKAENTSALYNSSYNAVNKAFGLNRTPGDVERKFINKWVNQYGFDNNIIVEACNRTLLAVQKPDFKYADRILENWQKNNVHHLSDIAKLDEAHIRSTPKIANKSGTNATSTNKFTAFPQRNYSSADYSSMEQRLLRK